MLIVHSKNTKMKKAIFSFFFEKKNLELNIQFLHFIIYTFFLFSFLHQLKLNCTRLRTLITICCQQRKGLIN